MSRSVFASDSICLSLFSKYSLRLSDLGERLSGENSCLSTKLERGGVGGVFDPTISTHTL